MGLRPRGTRVVFLVLLGTAGFVTTLYLRGAPEHTEREEWSGPIVQGSAVGQYYDAVRHVEWAKRKLQEALRHLQAALPAPNDALDDALRSLHRLEGVHAERARPFIRTITELRDGSSDVATEEVEHLLRTMDSQIVGELEASAPDTPRVLAEAEGTSDHHRCRLGMGYLSTYVLLDDEPELADSFRRTGIALLRTVDGQNRGLARFVLGELDRADGPTTMSDTGAVSYAAWRCE